MKFQEIFHLAAYDFFHEMFMRFSQVLPQVEALLGLSLSQLHQPLHATPDAALGVATQARVTEGGAAV